MADILISSVRGIQTVPLASEFLKRREVFLNGTIDNETCSELIEKLLYLDSEKPGEEITVYINSGGGSVQDGLGLVETISLLNSPVRAVCTGFCGSMAAVIYLCAEKREIMKHGKIMIHAPSYGSYEMGGKKPDEIQVELDNLRACNEILAEIIAEKTGHTIEEIKDVTAKDAYYTAEEALAYGLATKIITEKGGIRG